MTYLRTMLKFSFLTVCFVAFILLLGCERNHAPVIVEITQEQDITNAGGIHTFTVKAGDEDGDLLHYEWFAESGTFISDKDKRTIDWRSPADGEGQTVSLKAVVSDGELSDSATYQLQLTAPILGSITGRVFYAKCRIPVPEVSIQIGGKETLTDRYGRFSILDVVSGKDTLKAGKEDFGLHTSVVSIPPNGVLSKNIELLTVVHSTKVFGKISDQNGEAISGAEVVFLNPDYSDSRLYAKTDDNGVYRISYVPHGYQTIVVTKAEANNYRYSRVAKTLHLTELEQQFDYELTKEVLSGFFTDERDGNKYGFRTISDQTWMSTNLAYLPKVIGPDKYAEGVAYYYVYGFNGVETTAAKEQTNFKDLGVLYNWTAAQTACPKGWRLPSQTDIYELIRGLGGRPGYKLKAASGWLEHGSGDNSSGFAALPGGYMSRDGFFRGLGTHGLFMSSTASGESSTHFLSLEGDWDHAWISKGSKAAAYSVRCIRE